MKLKLVKLKRLSGFRASLYSFYVLDQKKTLFEMFLEENSVLLKNENFILRRLSEEITTRIKEGSIKYTGNSMDFNGDLEFEV